MLPQLTAAQYVNDFLQQLLDDAGMDTVSAEVRDRMLNDLRAQLDNWVPRIRVHII